MSHHSIKKNQCSLFYLSLFTHSLVSNFLGIYTRLQQQVDDLYAWNYDSLTWLFALSAAAAAAVTLSLLWTFVLLRLRVCTVCTVYCKY